MGSEQTPAEARVDLIAKVLCRAECDTDARFGNCECPAAIWQSWRDEAKVRVGLSDVLAEALAATPARSAEPAPSPPPLSDGGVDLSEIEARAKAATPGPWLRGSYSGQCNLDHGGPARHNGKDCDYRSTFREGGCEIVRAGLPDGAPMDRDDKWLIAGQIDYETGGIKRECDADFIAHARTDIPALIAEVKSLRERPEWWRLNIATARLLVLAIGPTTRRTYAGASPSRSHRHTNGK